MINWCSYIILTAHVRKRGALPCKVMGAKVLPLKEMKTELGLEILQPGT